MFRTLHRVAAVTALCAAMGLSVTAAGGEWALIAYTPDGATLSVFGGRPLAQAAKAIAEAFGVEISVEEPPIRWPGDLEVVGRSPSGTSLWAPKPVLLEAAFHIDANGRPADVAGLIDALVQQANAEHPFDYHASQESDGSFTVAPRLVRNEDGRLVPFHPALDTPVTIPAARRTLWTNVVMVMDAVRHRTGLDISCCFGPVWNVDLSQVTFGAENEPARRVLRRLRDIRLSGAPAGLVGLQQVWCDSSAPAPLCFVQWTAVTMGGRRR